MAHLSEFTEKGTLQCGSVNHPQDADRNTMYLLTKNGGYLVFGCKLCTEITGQPQLHFITDSEGGRKIASKTRKAVHIEYDKNSKITSFH